jgi:beta-glucanase (GH16 family)
MLMLVRCFVCFFAAFIFFGTMSIASPIGDTTGVTPLSSKKMKLIWADDFNIPGKPDSTKWAYDIGNGPNGWGNWELQFYTDRTDNAVVENGVLKVKAKREPLGGYAYTSARMVTRGKFEFTYGSVEIRAKLPAEIGTWPAVWMLGKNISSIGWPACGEIDILEHRGKERDKIITALHYTARHGENPDKSETIIPNSTKEFHIYRLDWTKESINLYIDNKQVHAFKNEHSLPYNADFYLLVNMAMGGGFGGPVDPDFKESTFEIDYIRVYK